ncbi:putative F-box/kelch-repeat protein At1g12870 [Solanum pennellii]|uniref:F-box/kelch-repeat protein At1g12870 n=1 Tax=Solanum pennellii TaxID=28526 RepID=A0ABM1HM44_SOLPN|nr:putative F-box/kelch-repeat protein At1g12870 [Solanum pennellii]
MVNRQRKNKLKFFNQTPRVLEPSKKANPMDMLDQAMKVYFEEGILIDIISRLPVQSVLRFKCVSKFWKILIDEPYFKMRHLNHAKNDQNSKTFLCYQQCFGGFDHPIYSCSLWSTQLVKDTHKLNLPLNIEPEYFTISKGCDGLFIINVFKNTVKNNILLLWNPSTRESMELPVPEFSLGLSSCLGLSVDSSGDYKILKIEGNEFGDRKVPGEIFSLENNSWRKIGKHPRVTRNKVPAVDSLAFIHGAFHWIGINSKTYFVVSFNISHEVFGEISLPKDIGSLNTSNVDISILEGMLCAYSNMHDQKMRTFKVWVMRDYNLKESWNAILSIEDRYLLKATPKYRFANGEILFMCAHLHGRDIQFRTKSGPF